MNANPEILIVDDSVYSRRALKRMIEELMPHATFTYASSGDEGLQLAFSHKPALIFLDLEMPRMDGYTFLRLLMSREPLPVVIVSGRNDHESVLKALELGALDFIAKPTRQTSTRIFEIRDELQQKLEVINTAKLRPTHVPGASANKSLIATPEKSVPAFHSEPTQLICIGASTGGPGTISRILQNFQFQPWATMVIVQHMPAGFTKAFAERLDRTHSFPVREISDLDRIEAGSAYVAPGGANVEISRGRDLRFRVVEPGPKDRFIPNVDLLFASAAQEFGLQAVGVVLTGMGNDGTEGSRAIRGRGGTVIAESAESAIVNGMPAAAIEAGAAQHVLRADTVAGALEQWMRGILDTA